MQTIAALSITVLYRCETIPLFQVEMQAVQFTGHCLDLSDHTMFALADRTHEISAGCASKVGIKQSGKTTWSYSVVTSDSDFNHNQPEYE